MKTLFKILSLASLSISFTTSSLQAETLGDVMKAEGIDKMLGTWVDAETNGEKVKMTYRWKIKGHAVELSLKMEDTTSSALIVYDQGSEEILHMGVNSKGGIGRGTWSTKDGAAILDLTQTNAEGQKFEIKVAHSIVDKNSLSVEFEMVGSGESGQISLVRPTKKPKVKKEKTGEKKKKAE